MAELWPEKALTPTLSRYTGEGGESPDALRRRALLRRGDTQGAEFLDRPLTQEADAGEVVPQCRVEVSPEVFTEHHVFALLGYLVA